MVSWNYHTNIVAIVWKNINKNIQWVLDYAIMINIIEIKKDKDVIYDIDYNVERISPWKHHHNFTCKVLFIVL